MPSAHPHSLGPKLFRTSYIHVLYDLGKVLKLYGTYNMTELYGILRFHSSNILLYSLKLYNGSYSAISPVMSCDRVM